MKEKKLQRQATDRSGKLLAMANSQRSMAEAARSSAQSLRGLLDGSESDKELRDMIADREASAEAYMEKAEALEKEAAAAERQDEAEAQEEAGASKDPLWVKAGDKAIPMAVKGAMMKGAVQTAREDNPELFEAMSKHWPKLDSYKPREVNGLRIPSAALTGEFAAQQAAEAALEAVPAMGLG